MLAAPPIPTPETIALQAVRRADDGRLFLVAPGAASYTDLRDGRAGDPPAAAFARALPDDYRAVASETFPGLFGVATLTVYALEPTERADRRSTAQP